MIYLNGNGPKIIEKIARCTHAGMDDEFISEVTGLSEKDIAEVRELDDYKSRYAELFDESFQRNLNISEGIEVGQEMSLGIILDRLQYTHDIDTAMKAFAVLNRAYKPLSKNNTPLDAQAGRTVAVPMPASYIQLVKQNVTNVSVEINETKEEGEKPKKVHDITTPGKVEKLLMGEDTRTKAAQLLDELDIEPRHVMVPAE